MGIQASREWLVASAYLRDEPLRQVAAVPTFASTKRCPNCLDGG
jgi:hypothetical protein